jgi:glycosyltransferase involved in cell wall biosynthesis
MQRDGLDVTYANLVSEQDQVFLRHVFGENFGNPRGLENVHTCILEEPLWRPHKSFGDLIASAAPDIVLGFGFIAARLAKLAAPSKPLVFMTSGCSQTKRLLEAGAIGDFIGFRRNVERGVVYPVRDEQERRAVAACELIVIHSPLVSFAFEHFFPAHVGKIYANLISVADFVYPEAEPFAALRRPFEDRDIDVVFVASSWKRPEKNYRLVKKIVSRCDGLNVHIVGDVHLACAQAFYHGVVARRQDLYALLGRSKVIVSTSLIDPAPGILFEASAMGCNVVATPNCGNWQLCHPRLLADRCSADTFFDRIKLGLMQYYPDNAQQFRGGYEDLVDTLRIF